MYDPTRTLIDTHSPTVIAALDTQAAAFRFVALLAGELSRGRVELPAFPEAVARVKQALSNPDASHDLIAKVVATEPGLAARLMTLANSAIMNPGGKAITELKSAVARIGYNNVRSTAVAYAVSQLRLAESLQGIRGELERLWKEATGTAALAYVLARAVRGLNPDEAMLAGLVHNIGKVYILSRGQQLETARFSANDLTMLVRDWHASVGKAIVESWKFAAHIVSALGEFEDPDRSVRAADLTDVLTVASQLYPYLGMDAANRELAETLLATGACRRLGLNQSSLQEALDKADVARSELLGALG